jgi:hypothetical protein
MVTHHGSRDGLGEVKSVLFGPSGQETLDHDQSNDPRRCHFCGAIVSDFIRFDFLVRPRRRRLL